MMTLRGFLFAFATATSAALAAPASAAADAPFSAAEIFAADNAAVIYPDCTDARAAADYLGKHADTVTPAEALGAQQLFVECMNVKRAAPDRDRMRYLYLAAAGAAYLEAQHADDEGRAAAVRRGETYLSRIIPRGNRPGMIATYVPRPITNGAPSSGQKTVNANPQGQTVVAGVVMSGARPNWRFGNLAQALDEAYDAMLHPPGAKPEK